MTAGVNFHRRFLCNLFYTHQFGLNFDIASSIYVTVIYQTLYRLDKAFGNYDVEKLGMLNSAQNLDPPG